MGRVRKTLIVNIHGGLLDARARELTGCAQCTTALGIAEQTWGAQADFVSFTTGEMNYILRSMGLEPMFCAFPGSGPVALDSLNLREYSDLEEIGAALERLQAKEELEKEYERARLRYFSCMSDAVGDGKIGLGIE
jgi:hypothetical protein